MKFDFLKDQSGARRKLTPVVAGVVAAALLAGLLHPQVHSSVMPAAGPAASASGKMTLDAATRATQETYCDRVLTQFREGHPDSASFAEVQAQLMSWLSSDPKACIEFLKSHHALSFLTSGMIEEASLHLGKEDPMASLRIGLQIEDSQIRSLWIKSAFKRVATQSPTAAFEALGVVPPVLRDRLARDLAWIWGKQNGKQAVEAFANCSFLNRSLEHITPAWLAWSASEPDQALNYALHTSEPGKTGMSRISLATWFVQEGSAESIKGIATALCKHPLGDPDFQQANELLMSISRRWAANDPEAAAKWASGLATDIARSRAISSVSLGMLRTNPALALQLADQSLGAGARQQIYGSQAGVIAETDGKKALEWASEIGDPLLRNSAQRSASAAWLSEDPAGAIRYICSEPNEGARLRPLVSNLESLPSEKLAAALASIDSATNTKLTTVFQRLPSSAKRDRILSALARQ